MELLLFQESLCVSATSDTTSCWPSSLRVSTISSRPWRVWWWCHRSWSSWPTACSTTPCLTCGKERRVRRSHYPPHDIGVLTMLQTPPSVFSPCVLLLCFLKINRPRRRPRPTRPWSLWPPGWRICFRGLTSCRDGSLTAFHPSTGSAASSSLRLSSLEPSRITPGAPRTPSTPSDWTLRWVGDPDTLCGTTATVMSLFDSKWFCPCFGCSHVPKSSKKAFEKKMENLEGDWANFLSIATKGTT